MVKHFVVNQSSACRRYVHRNHNSSKSGEDMKFFSARQLAVSAVVAGVTLSGVLLGTGSASANSGSGHYPCLSNDLCYWYDSNFGGAAEGVRGSVYDLASPATYFEGAAGADGVGTR